jgi:hypothetical protein
MLIPNTTSIVILANTVLSNLLSFLYLVVEVLLAIPLRYLVFLFVEYITTITSEISIWSNRGYTVSIQLWVFSLVAWGHYKG